VVSLVLTTLGCALSHPVASTDVSRARDGGLDASLDGCIAAPETCDGRDDDCDGAIDEASCNLEGAESSCVRGICRLDRCVDGRADCDGTAATGCEIELSSDRQNCGGCGVTCRVSEACESGECVRERIVDLDVGHSVVAVLESGRVVGWGRNLYGELDPEGADEVLLPLELPGVPRATAAVEVGGAVCVLDMDGVVWCRGYCTSGACGNEPLVRETPLRRVPLVARVVSLNAGHTSAFVCASLKDGAVWCWGALCDVPPHAAPVREPELETALAADWTGQWFFTTDGTALSGRGTDRWGQLGRGAEGPDCPDTRVPPTRVPFPAGERVIAIHALRQVALAESGRIVVWGDNSWGRLGEGAGIVSPPTTPHVIPGLPPAVAVGAGYENICLLTAEGTVWCWGERDLASFTHTPAPVMELAGVSRMELDGDGSCVVVGERSLRCWGQNMFGAVGNGTIGRVTAPVPPVGFEGTE
jgi:alpha-tubulin suppressor-like RCC1 family protein